MPLCRVNSLWGGPSIHTRPQYHRELSRPLGEFVGHQSSDVTEALAEQQRGGLGVLLNGVAVDDRLVRELAAIVDGSLRGRLESALLFRAKVVGLTVEERGGGLGSIGAGAGGSPGPARSPGSRP